MAEDNGFGVPSMLTTDPYLQCPARLAPLFDRHTHEGTDPLSVDTDKGVLGKESLRQVARKELSRVVSRKSKAGLSEIVCTEGKELGLLGNLVGHQTGTWQLNHGSNHVSNPDTVIFHGLLGDPLNDLPLRPELLLARHQGDHDLWKGIVPFLA